MILVNAIKCKKCGDIIESTSRHDFRMCSCDSVGVDGGHNYLRRVYSPEAGSPEEAYIEMSVEKNDPSDAHGETAWKHAKNAMYKCTLCGYVASRDTKYCPDCGQFMDSNFEYLKGARDGGA